MQPAKAANRRVSRAAMRLRTLARDARGVTIIEFAFVAGPLIALIMATLQISLTFFVQQNLETAAEMAVRSLVTGKAQASGMTQAQFKTLVCSKLPSFMKCSRVMIDVQAASSFSSIDTGMPTIMFDSHGNPKNQWVYQPGAVGQITIARIMYIWDTQKAPLGFDLSTMSNNKRLLMSVSVFKTEPKG